MEIELLFRQLKHNFPLRYFYSESANAIKIQIWVTLMVIQKRVKRTWSFSGLATMVRIMLMYYVNLYTFLEEPEKDQAKLQEGQENPPPQLSLFDQEGLLLWKNIRNAYLLASRMDSRRLFCFRGQQ